MELTSAWRSVFESWPANLPRTGLIVLPGQEPIAFIDFLIGEGFILIDRDRPDASGARKVIIALSAITAVKLTTSEELASLRGFTEGGQDVGLRAAAAVRRSEDLAYRHIPGARFPGT